MTRPLRVLVALGAALVAGVAATAVSVPAASASGFAPTATTSGSDQWPDAPGARVVARDQICARAGWCMPAATYVTDPITVESTYRGNHRCPRGYVTWWFPISEPGQATTSFYANRERDRIDSPGFTATVVNWAIGPRRMRILFRCRRDLLFDESGWQRVGDAERAVALRGFLGSLVDRDNPNTWEFARNLVDLILEMTMPGVGTIAPAHAAATAATRPRMATRVQPGANALTVLYRHPTRLSLPPAAVLRLEPRAQQCRANRLFSLAVDGKALMGVRLDCPPSAAGAQAVLEARSTIRRTFRLRNGRMPLKVSIPLPRGEVSAYARIETRPRSVPCRATPVRIRRSPRSVDIRTTATCRGLDRGARGVVSVGGLIDGSAR